MHYLCMTTGFANDQRLLFTVKKQLNPFVYDTSESQALFFAHKVFYGVVADSLSDFGILEVLLLS